MSDLRVRLNLHAAGFEAGLRKAQAAAGGFARNIGSAVGGAASRFASLTAGIGSIVGVASGAAAALKSINAAADMEQFRVGFTVMLGSAAAAKKRMEELAKFAATTPFELPEIAEASRVLQVLTGGALSTGKGLTLVGDIAAGTGRQFAEVAMWVGRLYDGLQSGRPVGEAMMRLQEMGVISGKTRGEIERLQKAGVAGSKVWESFASGADVKRYAGSMEMQSKTFKGLMSTFSDETGAVFRNFGEPLNEALKPIIEKATSLATSLQPAAARFGAMAGDAVKIAEGLSKSGGWSEAMSTAIQIVGIKFQGLLKGMVAGSQEMIGQGFAALFEPSLWSAMVQSWTAAVNEMAAVLVDTMSPALSSIQNGFTWLFEQAMAGPGGGAKRKQADKLDAEAARLKELRDSYLSTGERENALGAQRQMNLVTQQRADLGYVPRSREQIDREDSFALGGLSSDDLRANAKSAAAAATTAWKEFGSSGALSSDALAQLFEDAFKTVDTSELEKKLAGQLRAAWDTVQASAPKAPALVPAAKPAAGAAAATPAPAKPPSISKALEHAISGSVAADDEPLRQRADGRHRIDARPQRHRDLWGRTIWQRSNSPTPGTTPEEATRGGGAAQKQDVQVATATNAITTKLEAIEKTLSTILTKMPTAALA